MIEVLYFARLRERLGCEREQLDYSPALSTVQQLATVLRERGGAWASELALGKALRVAVNQRMATPDTAIADGDEVAFFPPVTGG
jgi:molybdopterin synthase sulfur carrier subunit